MSPASARPLWGALAILAGCLSFGANSIFVKWAAVDHDPWTISLVRFILGVVLSVVCLVSLAQRRGQPVRRVFRVTDKVGMAWRAVFGCSQMVLFFVGVVMTSSGRATLLMCTHPIFAALFGLLFFGERLPKVVFAGIAAGFAGAIIVFYDGSTYSLVGNLICLAAAASNGLAMHFVKRVRQDHNTFLVYLAPCLLGLAVTAFSFPQLATVTAPQLLLLLTIGGLSFLGQVLMAWGLRFLPATAGSMLGLSEIVFALSLSAAFLGEVMLPRFFLGTAVILGGLVLTVIVIQRSRRRA